MLWTSSCGMKDREGQLGGGGEGKEERLGRIFPKHSRVAEGTSYIDGACML